MHERGGARERALLWWAPPVARTLRDPDESPPWARGKLLALVVALGALSVAAAIYRGCEEVDVAETSAPASASASAAPAVALATRCEAPSGVEPLVIGELPKEKPRAPEDDAGAEAPFSDDDEPDEADLFAPFAVVLGRGSAVAGGFAVPALERGEGGTLATLRVVGEDGRARGPAARLARASGDVEAPVAIGDGASVIVAFLEPNANGRDLLLARVDGEKIAWGAELSEGSDESLALDLAVTGGRVAVVWDDLGKEGDARVMFALLGAPDLGIVGKPRPITGDDVEAEVPRIVPREGGFWLAYVARRAEALGSVPKPPPEERETPAPDDEVDERRGGEELSQTWIEIIPLAEDGTPAGAARDVTPRDGHVLAYDMAAGPDGSALLVWRDERSPVGGSGGSVSFRRVALGGLDPTHLVQEEDLEAGVPQIVGRWLAVMPASGPVMLAPLSANGELAGPLLAEPAVGRAQPIAEGAGGLLVGSPLGKAMKLSIVTCNPD